ncbi:MAG: dephospho-CoA kinase [Anaerolineae bacterium]|nr:dephospho-CoA kinase [Anaerolineae bacterium]
MSRWEGKTVIGLTGNIATGKSLVRRMLEHLKAYTVDADGLAHQAMAPGAPAYKPTILTFGQWILDKDKRIDRSKLGAVAFAHPEALARLEAITHPIVGRAIDSLIQSAQQEVVVVEAIKLLEGQLADKMDVIWVVDCDEEQQKARLMSKRGLTELEALKRIRVQNPQADKLAHADVVLNNNGTPEQTWVQVQAAWARLKGKPPVQAVEEDEVQQIRVQPTPATTTTSGQEKMAVSTVNILRGKPKNADQIAALLQRRTGREFDQSDVLVAFGEKSYMLAMVDDTPVGLVGFLVENLITQVDEFVVIPEAPTIPVATAMIEAMEQASRDLQSEVGYIFLPPDEPQETVQAFLRQGYEHTAIDEISVPAWRETARDACPEGASIYAKKLRAERVLKPL